MISKLNPKQCLFIVVALMSFHADGLPFWKGPGGSGGGDPHAIEFLSLASNTLLWLKGTSDLKKVDRARFAREVEQLRNTLDIPILIPRLRFVDEPVFCLGVPKIGCTVNRTVTINRPEWKALKLSQKYEIVALEVFVLMEMMSNRYSYAQEIGKNARAIEAGAEYRRNHPEPKLVLVSVGGASRFEGLRAMPVIFGGTQGSLADGTCANRGPDSTCDNCVDFGVQGDGGLIGCNRDRIFPELKLQLTLQSVSVEGFLKVVMPDGSFLPLAADSDREITLNHSATIKVEWREICAAFGYMDKATCSFKFGVNFASIPLKLGVGPNATVVGPGDIFTEVHVRLKGIDSRPGPSLAGLDCGVDDTFFDFEMYPGDESAYVEEGQVCAGFPLVMASPVRFIRMFYQPVTSGGFLEINPATDSFDITVNEDASLDNTRIDGLMNSVEYAFKAAFVDEAGNVGFYTPAALDKPEHLAQPSPVIGR